MVTDSFKRPLRDLRVSVTDRCNFRCPYCMPAEIYGERYEFLNKAQLLTFEETARLAAITVRLGVSKVRLTGGEPLVRSDVEKLVAMLSMVDGIDDLTMTTNGYLLPQKAQALKDAGLHRVTVSLDSLDDDVFKAMNGRGFGTDKVLDGLKAAERAGLAPIKINMVVKRGLNDASILDMARHFRGTGHVLRFIEYMDVGHTNGWRLDDVVSASEIVRTIGAEFPLEPLDSNYTGEVANRYRYQDGAGEIGIIASVTQPFCGDCTRARLSPEGALYTCLFATVGHDLRALLRDGRSDEEIGSRLRSLWGARDDRYSELRSKETIGLPKVEMSYIGG